MRKSTHNSKRKRRAAIKRRNNRLKFIHKELAAAAECGDNEDRISQLPSDILISIISHLTLREATVTSILSTRWRYLCTYATHLNFPPFEPKISPIDKYLLEEIQEKGFPNYLNMINHILDSHKSSQIKEFRVHMHCLEGANIERWLKFALEREVEIIDIHMRYAINARRDHYRLQLSNLIRTNSGQSLRGFKCLKELSLSSIYVDDREVEFLLSNFPLLESLYVELSDGLTNVLITGHVLLKHLGISYASNLQSVEIGHMINLVSLRCYRLPSTYILRLNNVPKLIEFSTSDQSGNTLAEVLSRMPSCIHDQLRLLKLSTHPSFIMTHRSTYMLPELINIRHLELEVHMSHYDNNTFKIFPLIEACCSLEKLEIKFLWWPYGAKFKDKKIFPRHPRKELSPNLKNLKLSGYLGSPSELELALFIVNNVVALEEVIVEPCDLTRTIQRMATARARQHFRPTTLDSINIVIV